MCKLPGGMTLGKALLVAAVIGVAGSGFSAAASERPSVRFHAAELIECRDVTPETFAWDNPGEKVVEARFRVSVLVTAGDPRDVNELLITIASPGRRVRVVDFLPRTELTTDQTGPKELVATREDQRRLEAGLGGEVSGGYGSVNVQGKPSASAGLTNHVTLKETYRQLPALELLVASGVTSGEHGVFFKLKRSTQSTLEGTHDFCCLFAVPVEWRGDWLQLSCRAHGEFTEYLVKRTQECGEVSQLAGFYLAGDSDVKFAAQRLAAAQAELRERRDDAESSPRAWSTFADVGGPRGLLYFPGLLASGAPRPKQSATIDPRTKLAHARSALARFSGCSDR